MADLTKDEIVKKEIQEQAQKLFQQYGLKKTTMDEIAMACGKAKSTLYHYFKSKEEVFEAVFMGELRSLRVLVKEQVEAKKTLNEKISTYFIHFHERIIDKANLFRAVKQELINVTYSHEHFKTILNFEKPYIARILEDGIDTGELKDIAKEEIPWLSEIAIAAFFGIVRHSIETENGLDINKLKKAADTFIPKIIG